MRNDGVRWDTNKVDPNVIDGDSQWINANQDVTNTMQNEWGGFT